jgi:hypothetical protein
MHGSPIQRQNRSSGGMIDQEIDSQARDPKNAPESAGQAAGRWQAARQTGRSRVRRSRWMEDGPTQSEAVRSSTPHIVL